MKAIKTALFCSLFIHGMTNSLDESPGSQLASRLAELSKSHQPTIHKSYREDTQTVTLNDEGKYEIHVESVIGEQDDLQDPQITTETDEYTIDPSDLSLGNEEDRLNKIWEQIWQRTKESDQEIVHHVAPMEKDTPLAKDTDVPLSDEWIIPAEWQYFPHDKLPDNDDVIIPELFNDVDYSKLWDDYSKYVPYENVWDFDSVTGDWKIDPIKYKKKYGIELNMDSADEGTDSLTGEIQSLEKDIDEEEATIEVEKTMVDELKDEKEQLARVKQEEENELDIADIISVDPITGKIKVIDEEGFEKFFGVKSNFEDKDVPAESDKWWSEGDDGYPVKSRNIPTFEDRMKEYNKYFSDGDMVSDAKGVAAGAA